MVRTSPGRYIHVTTGGEPFRALVPAALPPRLEWTAALRAGVNRATLAIGRLDAIAELAPDYALLLYGFIRQEAVLSSQIEGTQSSLADLLLFEIDEQPGVPLDDAREVSRCVAALEHGLKRIRGGFPLCTRLLSEMHKVLMRHLGGRSKQPGEIRRSQVWVGGSRPSEAVFVPPPASELHNCLRDFDRYLNDAEADAEPLIKAAFAHVQFETIHPYLDGNGRLGRLLIVLQMIDAGLLREPALYPSLFFKRHRQRYYDLLNGVRLRGEWEAWLAFFVEAVEVSATRALETSVQLLGLLRKDAERIATMGRPAASALAVHQALRRQPIATSNSLVAATGLTPATVNKSLEHLLRLGVVEELTNRKRGRVFSYRAYVEAFAEQR